MPTVTGYLAAVALAAGVSLAGLAAAQDGSAGEGNSVSDAAKIAPIVFSILDDDGCAATISPEQADFGAIITISCDGIDESNVVTVGEVAFPTTLVSDGTVEFVFDRAVVVDAVQNDGATFDFSPKIVAIDGRNVGEFTPLGGS